MRNSDQQLVSKHFPLSSKYNPKWLHSAASGGANPLWLTEWLAEAMGLQAGMRVLDLGCGRAASSIFLHREFGVQVWATDLWFDPSENLQRICDAGVGDGVFPLHAEARSLPYPADFFDAIVSIDSFPYYGTDDLYLNYLARFLKPNGRLGIAGAGLVEEFSDGIPSHLQPWWEHELGCLHSPDWWRNHWGRTGIVNIEVADVMPDGWKHWIDWQNVVAPDNSVELDAIRDDAGRHMGYVRVVGRRNGVTEVSPPIGSIPAEYDRQPLLRLEE